MKGLIDDETREVNLRTIVPMDHEPMHLLQAMQGMMIVVTNDFIKAIQS
jgi:hypothetical protein